MNFYQKLLQIFYYLNIKKNYISVKLFLIFFIIYLLIFLRNFTSPKHIFFSKLSFGILTKNHVTLPANRESCHVICPVLDDLHKRKFFLKFRIFEFQIFERINFTFTSGEFYRGEFHRNLPISNFTLVNFTGVKFEISKFR